MARFLYVSIDGLVGDVAWRTKAEGHDVRYFIENEAEREIADGFVEKVDDWEAHVEWADTIVFDDIFGMGTHAERLREEGHHVVGGTAYTDRLEDDRNFGQRELQEMGIETLPHREFRDFDEAVQFIRDNPDPYVIKPSGQVQNVKRLVFVGEEDDGADTIRILQSYKKSWGDKIERFELQKRADGVEIAIGAFFNGSEFLTPVCMNFEHKRLFPGNVGPATGEMGTSMTWTGPNRLFRRTLKKLEPRLAEEGYVGYMDLNCIVNGEGIYPLEFTPRFGYPTIFLMEESMQTPIGDFFHHIARGESPELSVHEGFQIAVRVCLPPFPFTDEQTFSEFAENAAIGFESHRPTEWTERDQLANAPEGVHIEDVKCEGGQWRVAGSSGVVLVVTGMGLTMREAQEQAYERVDNVVLPNKYYRDDIGERWVDGDGDRLHAWGYFGEE
ncbi:phosphoribosylglycinamide synthetase C domain-containing protein [Halogranum rubrum]|uniref:phosphoribosylamine--glycine ligase n=1 Tax=Halogranum salarium B-1 TaxID=1210908 RepID=J2ZDG3_9EURY|nr:phosphoribosylglycinamide synthetase C domain-containing protein [Halogranum salarium]EJN58695.1 phosphoribosylglycinamide synthetase [Halogranum salarium B-1]